jgi:membrane-associated phospholipid phosphatase
VLAVLIVWAHRGLPTFWPALVLNGLMLVSVPPAGNHYLTDMIGGATVVALAIAATSRVAFAR